MSELKDDESYAKLHGLRYEEPESEASFSYKVSSRLSGPYRETFISKTERERITKF